MEGGGNDEEYMNLLADAMVPYLRASGIRFTRSNPWDSLSDVIEETNEQPYDYVLTLQTTASPPDLCGRLQGPEILYYAYSSRSKTAAGLVDSNLKAIYPKPNQITIIPNKTLRVLRDVDLPSVLVNIGYRDNNKDAQWIKNNLNLIARQLVLSIAEYLGTPFVDAGNSNNI